MVLPSLVQNVFRPNAKYHCDVFVHYYTLEQEESGRGNRGGTIDAHAVEELEHLLPIVKTNSTQFALRMQGESEEAFWAHSGNLVRKFQTELDPHTGKPKYMPWACKDYSAKQVENIVKQWHSIESVWNLMNDYEKEAGFQYDRVAFLRADVFFPYTLDIYAVGDKSIPVHQRAVVPAFGKDPVNDRLMIGPRRGVEIWARQRFSRLDQHIATYPQVGYGMHPERFLAHSIFPAIQEPRKDIVIVEDESICFYRVRPNDSMLISDCGKSLYYVHWRLVAAIERLVQKTCTPSIYQDRFVQAWELQCGDTTNNNNTPILFWLRVAIDPPSRWVMKGIRLVSATHGAVVVLFALVLLFLAYSRCRPRGRRGRKIRRRNVATKEI